ncbi:redoxin domain-containing protein [Halorussus amylolyticus]|uniref:redoxin domain-containing protein n=1 Tax=Halorussus amylolyticus TaxID=1126242 RepID=UPI00138ECA6C|nr:redoxin domain-containing protein [Halorussus amylolyticus]
MDDSAAPDVGSKAPAFTARLAAPDGTVSEVSLSSLCEESVVLLVFQPTDFELETFAERAALGEYDWFSADDRVRVVGVNRARPTTNREFIDYLDVTYPFCSDRDLSIAKAYGVTYRAFGVAPRARRACFFVDHDGVVRYRWVGDRESRGRSRPQAWDLYDAVLDVLGKRDPETFGLA